MKTIAVDLDISKRRQELRQKGTAGPERLARDEQGIRDAEALRDGDP